MGDSRSTFSSSKHDAVKGMESLKKSVFISMKDINFAQIQYGQGDYWKFISDEMYKKHGVSISDRERLVLYSTIDDNTMEIAGHLGYSVKPTTEVIYDPVVVAAM